jgi:DNA-binding NtrC family response regulator
MTGERRSSNPFLQTSRYISPLRRAEELKILLVDDNPEILKCLSESLNEHGFATRQFADSAEAFEAYKSEHFDVVITDYSMPGMNGLELLKTIRDYDPGAYLIVITGDADLYSTIKAVNIGARGFHLKPLRMEELLDSLAMIENEINRLRRRAHTAFRSS